MVRKFGVLFGILLLVASFSGAAAQEGTIVDVAAVLASATHWPLFSVNPW